MGSARIRVGIIGATGYGGGELVRLLERHPAVEIAGLAARGRSDEPIGTSHPHLAATERRIGADLPDGLDAVFLGLPHGAAAEAVPQIVERGTTVIDLGPDFRLRNVDDYPRWYRFAHPRPDLLERAVYGLPELRRHQLGRARRASDGEGALIASPGCYATAVILALAPLARHGLLGEAVVDAMSGVSGAGREPRPEMMFGEVNESVRAYGIGGHRHIAEMEQELGSLNGEPVEPIDFLPHLVPMTRGILASCHVRVARPTSQAELLDLYGASYDGERFVRMVDAPPATKHVLGSNMCHLFVRWDDRAARILVISVIDNLVKGAAGQAVQAFNAVFDMAEETGLEQLPLSP